MCVCVCISIFSLQMFSSPTFGPSFLLLFLSIAPATGQRGETTTTTTTSLFQIKYSLQRLCVLNLEVSRDGEDGLRSTIFATVPVNTFQSVLYLHCRLNVANCPSPLLNELFSIDWAQNLAALPKISDHPLVFSMIKCGSENFGEAARQKRSCQPGYAESSRGIQNER